MAKNLVIVESPSKAKTIQKYLGKNFSVTASVGHIKDLPKNELGVDVEKKFSPKYVTARGKTKVLKEIRALAKQADTIYLAPDPDREGEAIAWHLAEIVKRANKKADIHRVLITEITKKGVTKAIKNPRQLDQGLFESQQARRILDRLVGYTISPLLWDKVRRGLSAGRVQSVAVRLIVDREGDIDAFDPEEYWSIPALFLSKTSDQVIKSKLHKIKSKKADLKDEKSAHKALNDCKKGAFVVDKVIRKERKSNPKPAFTTSLLQQAAAHRLRFTARKTMQTAQKLYEGIELGSEGAVGLITYMRTDSTRISADALKACRSWIKTSYGPEYLPAKANQYTVKKSAQDAHEAIRPTDVTRTPETLKPYLSSDQLNLYRLIWRRFVSCQMKPALYDQTSVDIVNGDYLFRSSGSILTFDGHLHVYDDGRDRDNALPNLEEGEELNCKEIQALQHFTQPPPRFTEATLVKELEDKGIGRPSTYASIISTIQDKDYCTKDSSGRFSPTDLGKVVTELLVESFPKILDAGFTSNMESKLDHVSEGDEDWVKILDEFYKPFVSQVDDARESMRNLKKESTPTDVECSECTNQMVIKWGKKGYFLACSNYPECKNTSEFAVGEDGSITPIEKEVEVAGSCDECGKDMIVKTGKFGRFLACSGYPECKNTKPFTLDVPCPLCKGDITEKRSRRGKVFYGCSNYPECKFAVWDEPIAQPCPVCTADYLVKPSRGSDWRKCNVCQTSWASEEEFTREVEDRAEKKAKEADGSTTDDAEADTETAKTT